MNIDWDDIADKNRQTILVLNEFARRKECFMCRRTFPEGLLNKNPDKFLPLIEMFRGDFLFHLQSTHGIFPTDFLDMVKDVCLMD